MAPVPKKKHTRGRTGRRRLHVKLALPNLSPCPSCKKSRLSHRTCPHCGYYKP
ncbi:MAG: 50S ribosomal protein L32 [Candidatus Blackburnbacteria bacterium]|nr:50S ribosomal protein L32 [Candidatus Blackburnbacteria bacterium]MBI2590685.1 50S ribosomal protein L32 [Candidatus Blackburnbacteria bacterium]